MKIFFTLLLLISVVALPQRVAVQATLPQTGTVPAPPGNLSGRWRVTFILSGIGEKHLIFESQVRGSGSFLLLDSGPDNKAEADPRPAVWSQPGNNRVSFSGEVELPIGTCCRETGILIFKGKFISSNAIAGKAIFVGDTEDEENLNGFRSMVGTFTATPVPRQLMIRRGYRSRI